MYKMFEEELFDEVRTIYPLQLFSNVFVIKGISPKYLGQFENNFGIQNEFTKLLKESCR